MSLADARRDFGGRLLFETTLPGLKPWNRVVDYRLGQLRQDAQCLALSGKRSDRAGRARLRRRPCRDRDRRALDAALCGAERNARWHALDGPRVYTPDDLAAGVVPEGPVAVFDFDNYYWDGHRRSSWPRRGMQVTYITTAGAASAWTFMTNEQPLVHQALARRGIALRTLEIVTGFDGETLRLAQIFTGEARAIAARSLVIVGQRRRRLGALSRRAAQREHAASRSLHLTGDANAPGAIAHAVYQGHKTGARTWRHRSPTSGATRPSRRATSPRRAE